MPSRVDNYTLGKTLGAGVSAKVKLAQDPQGNQYALKIFDLQNENVTQKTVELLRNEVAIYRNLKHENIVRLFDFKENAEKINDRKEVKKVHYIVLEFVTGGELFDYVALQAFKPEICRFYFSQMLKALHLVHSQGACHRDLKPENVLLEAGMGYDKIKVIDFGTAQSYKPGQKLTETIGTPYYIAPEVLAHKYGKECDVWSVGVMTYIILSGIPPFNGSTDNEIMNAIKKGVFNFTPPVWKNLSSEAKDFIT